MQHLARTAVIRVSVIERGDVQDDNEARYPIYHYPMINCYHHLERFSDLAFHTPKACFLIEASLDVQALGTLTVDARAILTCDFSPVR